QGPVTPRWTEHLGESDKGLILYRRLLREQMQIVDDGGEPMNTFRDPAKNVSVHVPTESDDSNWQGYQVDRATAQGNSVSTAQPVLVQLQPCTWVDWRDEPVENRVDRRVVVRAVVRAGVAVLGGYRPLRVQPIYVEHWPAHVREENARGVRFLAPIARKRRRDDIDARLRAGGLPVVGDVGRLDVGRGTPA